MPIEASLLASGMHGLRLLATVLCVAIIIWWSPSGWRVLHDSEEDNDAKRFAWVPLAFGVLIYQAGWLYPGMHDLTRLRIWFVAQALIVLTLLGAIYLNGHGDERFRRRKAMKIHLAMLVLCVAFAALVR